MTELEQADINTIKQAGAAYYNGVIAETTRHDDSLLPGDRQMRQNAQQAPETLEKADLNTPEGRNDVRIGYANVGAGVAIGTMERMEDPVTDMAEAVSGMSIRKLGTVVEGGGIEGLQEEIGPGIQEIAENGGLQGRSLTKAYNAAAQMEDIEHDGADLEEKRDTFDVVLQTTIGGADNIEMDDSILQGNQPNTPAAAQEVAQTGPAIAPPPM